MGTETLRPVRATFVAFGIFWGTWAVAATNIEHSLHLSAGRLGLLLSASIGAGGLAAAASGGLAERWGTARFLSRTLVAWGLVSLASAGAARGAPFVITFVLTMTTAGLVDMAMNAAAAAGVAGDAARMMRFHALFNTGALIGAAAAGVLLRAGMSWRWNWAAVGIGGLVLGARTRRAVLPGAVEHAVVAGVLGGDAGEVLSGDAGAHDESAPKDRAGWLRSLAAIRSQHLVVLALVFAVTAMVEGGIDTWGVLYLRTHLAAGVLLGAGAYCMGQAIAVSTRGGAGGHIGRIGARWGLVIGTAVAAGGLALEAGSTRAATAAIGLALAAGGISLCWPLVMAVASTVALGSTTVRSPGPAAVTAGGDSVSPAALVGALTAAGYAGWVAGPALVGWVADSAGLSTGLFVLSGLAAAAAVVLALIPTRPSAVA
ncbi:MAG TPA: MFS transporter [Acidimicrobiales bacterium]|nr:MFS transporter [Acidimicrobiales bacterium]